MNQARLNSLKTVTDYANRAVKQVARDNPELPSEIEARRKEGKRRAKEARAIVVRLLQNNEKCLCVPDDFIASLRKIEAIIECVYQTLKAVGALIYGA